MKHHHKHAFERDSFWLPYTTCETAFAAGRHAVIGIIININVQACAFTVVLKRALMGPEAQIFLSQKLMV